MVPHRTISPSIMDSVRRVTHFHGSSCQGLGLPKSAWRSHMSSHLEPPGPLQFLEPYESRPSAVRRKQGSSAALYARYSMSTLHLWLHVCISGLTNLTQRTRETVKGATKHPLSDLVGRLSVTSPERALQRRRALTTFCKDFAVD